MRMLYTTKGCQVLVAEDTELISEENTVTLITRDGTRHCVVGAFAELRMVERPTSAPLVKKKTWVQDYKGRKVWVAVPDTCIRGDPVDLYEAAARPINTRSEAASMAMTSLRELKAAMIHSTIGTVSEWPYVGDDCEESQAQATTEQPQEELPCCCNEQQYQQGVWTGQGFSDTCPYHQQWRERRRKGLGL